MKDLASLFADCFPDSIEEPQFLDFVPLTNSAPLPVFPLVELSYICEAVCDFIFAASEAIQTSFDLVGSCTLSVLSLACMGRYPVCLPNGHKEQPCFYMVPIAPPSERKSGVIDSVSRPLVDYEKEYNSEHGGEVTQNKSKLRLLQGRIAETEAAMIKAKSGEDRLLASKELEELNNQLAEFETVEPLRLYGADVTPEKLAAMLKSQSGVFALMSAEGGLIMSNIDRYNDKGGIDIFLNAYSGDHICVDRKNSDSIVIDNPTLNLLLPCQPSVITDLFSDRQKAGRGLLSRMLFVKCYSRVGGRRFSSEPIDNKVTAAFHNLCRKMLAATSKGDLQFDDGGIDVCASFFDEIEMQLKQGSGELEHMEDWAGKLPGQMVRLAGLIHCIAAFEQGRDPLDSFITAKEAGTAAILARFFLAHAKAVYSEQGESETHSNARYLWKQIKAIGSKVFTKTDLSRKTHNRRNFNADEGLKLLSDRGYIRTDFIPTGSKPTLQITVNPKALLT